MDGMKNRELWLFLIILESLKRKKKGRRRGRKDQLRVLNSQLKAWEKITEHLLPSLAATKLTHRNQA